MAGRKRTTDHSNAQRRITDRPVYRAAQRAERVVIVAIGALAARSAGQDITRAILVLVALMAISELTDWFIFQHGYRSLFRDLDERPPARKRVRSAQPGAGNKRRSAGSRAQHRDHKKTADQAHKRSW